MNQDEQSNASAPRILPALDESNRAFWTGGAEGELLILWCRTCERWVHPPGPRCVEGHDALEARPVSGEGKVFTFTINHHPFHPAVPVPYVVAIVELNEQPDLRLIANISGCSANDVSVGMNVRVAFEQHEDHFVPVFEPA
jgi:uncharacterized OB-fold protein